MPGAPFLCTWSDYSCVNKNIIRNSKDEKNTLIVRRLFSISLKPIQYLFEDDEAYFYCPGMFSLFKNTIQAMVI